MDEIGEVFEPLDEVIELLGDVAGVSSGPFDSCRFVAQVEQVGRLVDTLRAVAAARIDHESRPELGPDGLARQMGHTKGVHLVEQLTRVSAAEASRRVKVGAAIAPRMSLVGEVLPASYPRLAEAMLAGEVGVDAAALIIRCLAQATGYSAPPPEHLDAAEEALVEVAGSNSADLVGISARVWREALDPDGAEPRDEQLRARRGLVVGRERAGMTRSVLTTGPVETALLRAALAEAGAPGVVPRDLSEEDRAGAPVEVGADGSVAFRDPRTSEQRQHDHLFGLITAGLRSAEAHLVDRPGSGPGFMRSTATVMAVIKLEDLQNGTGVGWLDDVDEPVSAATVQRMVCDAGFQTIVLGPKGEVLYLGTKQEFFTPAQRRALAVRDGGCAWTGSGGIRCSAPPPWCDAHHVIERQHGGLTDIDNGVLLCAAHHQAFHAGNFQMRMIDGKPHLLPPPHLAPAQEWLPMGRTRATMAMLPRRGSDRPAPDRILRR